MNVDTPPGWQERLAGALAETAGPLRRVRVYEALDSTQEALAGADAHAGDVAVALRQTAGRGRHGRAWADTGSAGVALSAKVDASMNEPHGVLALRCGIATAEAIDRSAGQARCAGIKWPNDVILRSRKVAGVLVEARDGTAIVGVGINVLQTDWPGELQGRAISMAEAGISTARLDVAEHLVRELNAWLAAPHKVVINAFTARDVLTGARVTVMSGGTRVTGMVRSIDPLTTIAIEAHEGVVHLPVATTTVLQASGERVELPEQP